MVYLEGDVFDDTAISEELLDDNDDVLNVRHCAFVRASHGC